MNFKIMMMGMLIAPLLLTACAKPEQAPASHATSASEAETEVSTISAEQQAAIDALDKPLQDENNTDVPAAVASAPADAATAEEAQ